MHDWLYRGRTVGRESAPARPVIRTVARRFGATAGLAAVTVALSACISGDDPVSFELDGNSLIAEGVIDERALEAFRYALSENPDVTTLVLWWVPGSADDDANLQLGRIVNSMGLETVVPRGGLVASGGTDLFLAGATRRIEPDACIGVHAWGDMEYGSGRNAPRDAPIHRSYLRFYDDIGIDAAFYWFTLDAADVEGMHWMTPAEQDRFAMTTEPSRGTAVDPTRCDARERW